MSIVHGVYQSVLSRALSLSLPPCQYSNVFEWLWTLSSVDVFLISVSLIHPIHRSHTHPAHLQLRFDLFISNFVFLKFRSNCCDFPLGPIVNVFCLQSSGQISMRASSLPSGKFLESLPSKKKSSQNCACEGQLWVDSVGKQTCTIVCVCLSSNHNQRVLVAVSCVPCGQKCFFFFFFTINFGFFYFNLCVFSEKSCQKCFEQCKVSFCVCACVCLCAQVFINKQFAFSLSVCIWIEFPKWIHDEESVILTTTQIVRFQCHRQHLVADRKREWLFILLLLLHSSSLPSSPLASSADYQLCKQIRFRQCLRPIETCSTRWSSFWLCSASTRALLMLKTPQVRGYETTFVWKTTGVLVICGDHKTWW